MIKVHPLFGTLIEIRGEQRLKWLQSYVTNDIRKLKIVATDQSGNQQNPPNPNPSDMQKPNYIAGNWLETFATDMKGKCLSHGCVFQSEHSVYFLCPAINQAALLLPFWQKYMFISDVEGIDVSNDWFWGFVPRESSAEFFDLCGARFVQSSCLNAGEFVWQNSINEPSKAVMIQGFALNDNYVLCGVSVRHSEQMLNLQVTNDTTTRSLAVESRFPWFGTDFNADNLPQEVDRDSLAISFSKGCYLGQETIARLDALGQVQKKLLRVTIDSNQPVSTPQNLFSGMDEKGLPVIAGLLTSAHLSENRSGLIGWAQIKRKFFQATTPLTLESGERVALI